MQAGNVLKNQHILYPLRRDETALYLASCLLCKYIHPTIHPVYAKWLHRFDCIVTFFHQSEWWGWAFLCYCSCNIESSPVVESPLSFWPFNMKFRLSRIAGLVWLNQWTERGRILNYYLSPLICRRILIDRSTHSWRATIKEAKVRRLWKVTNSVP